MAARSCGAQLEAAHCRTEPDGAEALGKLMDDAVILVEPLIAGALIGWMSGAGQGEPPLTPSNPSRLTLTARRHASDHPHRIGQRSGVSLVRRWKARSCSPPPARHRPGWQANSAPVRCGVKVEREHVAVLLSVPQDDHVSTHETPKRVRLSHEDERRSCMDTARRISVRVFERRTAGHPASGS